MQDDSVCRGRGHREALVQREVQITAADYNGKDWDGSPFSAIPEWLKEAIEQGLVSVEPSSTDYALWRVTTVMGPGDRIVRASLAAGAGTCHYEDVECERKQYHAGPCGPERRSDS